MHGDWPEFCRGLYAAAVRSADPLLVVPPALPDPSPWRAVRVIAFGKAAAAMARAFELAWPDVPLGGIAVCRYGYAVPCDRIEVLECAHPVPDAAGVAAANRALSVAHATGPDEMLLVLVSGGGSSLLCAPAAGISLQDKQRITGTLLNAGAPISDINCVRRHLSAIKGGRLARAAGKAGCIRTLAISDVVGDCPSAIASGPTVPDSSSIADAARVLRSYGIQAPESLCESIGPDDPVFARSRFDIIASGPQAIAAAVAYGRGQGFDVRVLADDCVGEARDIAAQHAAMVQSLLAGTHTRPVLLLSGGELTVTVKGDGQGGPNQEYLLALLQALPAGAPVHAFAADTDGMDGTGGAAGAWFTPEIRARAPAPGPWLDRNDSFGYFGRLGALFRTKPTLTNVNDLRAIAVGVPDH
ncbi:MAG: DUF4147 domain-containing protein [Alphaproteobacteria bacterium]|nr:MAG: DUF4147 domain-containing protein [Alphaproteobacteria bacterium]